MQEPYRWIASRRSASTPCGTAASALTTRGSPATDPSLYPDSAFLLPFAGHKGYGIALLIETLAGVLTGGAMYDVHNWVGEDLSVHTNHCAAFLAFNVGAMIPIDEFKNRVDRLIHDIHAAPKAEGTTRLFVPGEMEWEKRRKAMADGIPLPSDVLESLQGLADDLGMNAAWL